MRWRFIQLVSVASLSCVVSCGGDHPTSDNQPERFALVVSATGTGTGAISTSPEGVNCSYSGSATSGTCSASFASGTTVTLTATPAGGHTFAGWSGDCAGTSTCQVTMSQGRNVIAIFAAPLPTFLLTITGSGTGNGNVASSPGGINCALTGGSGSGPCSSSYTSGTVVTLTATPAAGHTFAGWSGVCNGTGTCQVTMDQARAVTATFTAPLPTFLLTITGSGTGSGNVTSSPGGINCAISAGSGSGPCSASYTSGMIVTLTATPAAGHTFAGWSGVCSGTGNCQVTMNQAQAATANFTAPLPTFVLTVTGGGTGKGNVTSSTGGINCAISGGSGSGPCSASYTSGTVVTLTATSVSGHTFAGWAGACSGTATCQVTMNQARSVTATFTAPVYVLSVTASDTGTGGGSVTSNPSGINCTIRGKGGSGTCSASYSSGTVVTLTATPIAAHTFSGWSSPCSGAGTCQVAMTQARTVTAAFTGQQIAVPAYFPATSSDWPVLRGQIPPANVIVINPHNGPGTGTAYASQIDAARTRGARVLGYVYTKYANTKVDSVRNPHGAKDRGIDSVEADIDQYYRLYPHLDGIFLDEVNGSSCSDAQSYYKPIYDYITRMHRGATVVINPGGATDPCYLDAASIVVTFENTFAEYKNNWVPSDHSWETNAYSSRIWHIVHTASASELSAALNLSRVRNAGYIYVTNSTTAPGVNTFGALPPYFPTEAGNVKAYGTTSP